MKRSNGAQCGLLTAPESRRGADVEVLRDVQEESQEQENRDIVSNGLVSKSSPLRMLKPFVVDQGLLRVRGGCHSLKIQKTKSFPYVYQNVIISLVCSSGDLMK